MADKYHKELCDLLLKNTALKICAESYNAIQTLINERDDQICNYTRVLERLTNAEIERDEAVRTVQKLEKDLEYLRQFIKKESSAVTDTMKEHVFNEQIPPKPKELAIWLYNNFVGTISVSSQYLTEDSAETRITLYSTDSLGNINKHIDPKIVDKSELIPLIDYTLDHNSVLRLKPEIEKMVAIREEWETKNAEELAEYDRLRKKFGVKN